MRKLNNESSFIIRLSNMSRTLANIVLEFYTEFQESGNWYNGETCDLSLKEIQSVIEQFIKDNSEENITTIMDTDPRDRIVDICEKKVRWNNEMRD